MAHVSEYPVEGDAIVRGDPHTVQMLFTHEQTPLDVSGWTFRCQVRRRPDGPLLFEMAPTIDVPPAGTAEQWWVDGITPNRLLLYMTPEQTRTLQNGMVFDVEQLTPVQRTWWIVTRIHVVKDVSRDEAP
jgi:hypothetical protein